MLEWTLPYVDNVVAAANFTTVVMMLALGSVASYLLITRNYGNDSDIKTILIGVAIEAYGWAAHRLYWGTWRTMRAWGHDDWNQWFVSHSFLSLIPASMVLCGLALILAPLWGFFYGGHKEGKRYYILPSLFMAAIWWFFFFVIVTGDKDHNHPPAPKPATVFKLDRGEVNEDSSIRHLKERGEVR